MGKREFPCELRYPCPSLSGSPFAGCVAIRSQTYFGEAILHLAEKKPELIFRDGVVPYKAGGSHGTLDR